MASPASSRALRATPLAADEAFLPRSLPLLLDPMLGRDDALHRVLDLVASGRLVTIVGPGGVGKTRLAVDVALRAGDTLDLAALYVPLASTVDPDHVMGAVASAAGLDTSGERPAIDIVADGLGGPPVLLVLDNLEHLVAASCQILGLLDRCPGLHVLATSRVALRVRGEVELDLQPLDVPETDAAEPSALAGSPSVELLLREVRRFDPSFELDAVNGPAVAEICRRLEGLPLAIELAAARLRLLAPAELVTMLSRRLDVLRSNVRDAPAHHHTLRAAIDWSYRLLEPEDRRLLRWLSAFNGGFTLDAVTQLIGGDMFDVLDRLDSLVAHHLVRVVVTDGDGRRFDLFDSIREFGATELITAGDDRAARDAHAAWAQRLVDESTALLIGPDQLVGLSTLDNELDNIRAALAWTSARSESVAGLVLAAPLWRYWWMRATLTEGRDWTARAIDGYRGEAGPELGRALLAAADLAEEQADCAEAESLVERAIDVFESIGDELGLAECWNSLGVVARSRGDLMRAESLHLKAASVCRELGAHRMAASALNSLASIAYIRGDLSAAESRWRETIDIVRMLGDRRALGLMLSNLANAILGKGNAVEAVGIYEESLVIAREAGDTIGIAHALCNIGGALIGAGDLDRAESMLDEALSMTHQHGLLAAEAVTLHSLGELARARGERRRAGELWIESLAAFALTGFTPGFAGCLESVAGLAVAAGRHELAAPVVAWAAASRDRDGSAPENDGGQAERDAAAVAAALDQATIDRCRETAAGWSAEDVGAAARTIVAALPEGSTLAPADSARLAAARRVGLTPRELEIADHLVRRHTDQEIAAALYVSVRTVTTHVSAVLRKLGVPSRRDVAARVDELGLAST